MESFGGFGGTIVAASCDAAPHNVTQGAAQYDTRPPRPHEPAWPTAERLLGLTNEELAKVDPVVMNLVVAKGIPSLAHIDIGRYVQQVDQWAADFTGRMPGFDEKFRREAARWDDDLDFFRLACLCWFLAEVVHIAYREDQRDHVGPIYYTDPNDLFLTGVLDTKRGACGSMALLYVALAQRLGWPVSLACVDSHQIARFDDGTKTINVEATSIGILPGIRSVPDREYIESSEFKKINQRAMDCGSDLRALTPREMLGVFFGSRARHIDDLSSVHLSTHDQIHERIESEPDYLVARYLFPRNRYLCRRQHEVTTFATMRLFDPGEIGHPIEQGDFLYHLVRAAPWKKMGPSRTIQPQPPKDKQTQEKNHVSAVNAVFQKIGRVPR